MRRIVVATDFSTRSDRASRRATLLAKAHGGELIFAHVLDDDIPPRLLKAERQEAEALLHDMRTSASQGDGVPCRYQIAAGEAFKGIAKIAHEEEADLIVLGPHRRQVLQDIFVGTTAERTIRNSNIPVLVAFGPPASDYRRVMLSTDLSPASANAVKTFSSFGSNLQASEIVYAFPVPARSQMSRAMLDDEAVTDYVADEEEAAREALKKFCGEVDLRGAKPVLKVIETTPAAAILNAAAAAKADLLVVGTRSRMGLARLLLGSTAENVLASSLIDVLAIPPRTG